MMEQGVPPPLPELKEIFKFKFDNVVILKQIYVNEFTLAWDLSSTNGTFY